MDENQANQSSNRQQSWYFYGRIYPGVFLILVGVIFMLNNYGFIQGQAWSKLWPIFIILPGIFMLLRPRRR